MTTYSIIGHRDGKVIASENAGDVRTAQAIAYSWRGGLCDAVFVSIDLTAAIASVDRIQAEVNDPTPWLTIDPTPRPDGRVDLVIGINGRFNAVADSDSPADVAKALGGLFGGLHGSVVTAADGAT